VLALTPKLCDTLPLCGRIVACLTLPRYFITTLLVSSVLVPKRLTREKVDIWSCEVLLSGEQIIWALVLQSDCTMSREEVSPEEMMNVAKNMAKGGDVQGGGSFNGIDLYQQL